MKCRHCATPLVHTFLDLGFAPPSNAYIHADRASEPEIYYPLRLKVCEVCWLVQTEDFTKADELFSADYAYFSSTSSSWLAHADKYVSDVTRLLALSPESFVIEVASNDGYLLKSFVAAGIPCLGIEPTDSTADAAEVLGVPVIRRFFGTELANELAEGGRKADLIIGNNVYAHVPDINDFTHGLKAALKPGGTITLEFPHLMNLIAKNQFDTVYHEHFSYLSLVTVARIFAHAGLKVVDVDTLPTHGGSLRVYGAHTEDARAPSVAVQDMLDAEARAGLTELACYQTFQASADRVKDDLLSFLIEQKRAGRSIFAYGAAAKGNTLLNYAGVKPDLLPCVFDAAPSKQGKLMPGSRIPILPAETLQTQQPDFVVILPWNIADEVKAQLGQSAEWRARFVTAVPQLKVWD